MSPLDRMVAILLAHDDEVDLMEGERLWRAIKAAAEKGEHRGDCTREPESCPVCTAAKLRQEAERALDWLRGSGLTGAP